MSSCQRSTRSKDGSTFADELSRLRTDLLENFNTLKDEVINMKEVVIKALKEENQRLKEKILEMDAKVINLETRVNATEQYGRRNNIEIIGIPDDVKINQLEDKVVEIFKSINVETESRDIEACHRLGKSTPKRTIVRFVNRKFAKSILYSRKRLKNVDKEAIGLAGANLYVSENLTD